MLIDCRSGRSAYEAIRAAVSALPEWDALATHQQLLISEALPVAELERQVLELERQNDELRRRVREYSRALDELEDENSSLSMSLEDAEDELSRTQQENHT